MNNLINGLELNSPTNMNLVLETESKLGAKFPNDYKEFIVQSNGAEGTVGNAYLQLWAIDELVELNEGYAVKEFADGLIIFGSDGGGTAYSFDTRYEKTTIVEVPFIGMDIDEITIRSDTFTGFLKYLASLSD
ncbi:SMI1/KNR4 family protein [Paenibacillus hexagrammi]|uniref:SMI1/KNR4 family protein n=1 Tax=Paenibacillus hexagrammi TaxID=2908839 RepID=A0ABY3SRF0_9BACL|nr:SMI1/KNR4 family protein [Paenibacillus sp. YPD9-1]UJF35736.1 SMI1/KNR4 family protein [Paenibacillus sp. YPD9-1]